MEFKKYAQGAEMNPMEALRLAQESRAFAAQGVEMPSDIKSGMAKYGMSDTQIMREGGDLPSGRDVEGQEMTRKEKRKFQRAQRKAKRKGGFTPPGGTTNLGD